MNARRAPVWMWLLGAFVVLRVLSELGPNLMPLLVLGFLAYLFLGQRAGRRGLRTGPGPRPAPPVGGPVGPGTMPTIDVPGYPGAPAEPADPWAAGGPAVPPPSPGMSSLGSDPAVTLVQLQVGHAGRDLEQAFATGDDEQVGHALRRLSATLEHAGVSLSGSTATGAAPVRAALDGLGAAVREAQEQGPGSERAALVARIITRCREVGQTGAL